MSGFLSDLGSNPIKAIGLAVVQLVILAVGLATLPTEYTEPSFAADYLPTLAVVTVLLTAVTFVWGRPAEIGLSRPEMQSTLWAIPLIVVVLVVAGALVHTWSTLPDEATIDASLMIRTFFTTMFVGFTEEWMYRGLLAVVFVKLWGFRTGTFVSAAAFGLFHILNVVGGQSVPATIQQIVFTALFGLTFTLMCLATRSIIPGMILHGLYDFFLFAAALLEDAGAEQSVIGGLPSVLAVFVGVITAIVVVLRHDTSHPFLAPVTRRLV